MRSEFSFETKLFIRGGSIEKAKRNGIIRVITIKYMDAATHLLTVLFDAQK